MEIFAGIYLGIGLITLLWSRMGAHAGPLSIFTVLFVVIVWPYIWWAAGDN